MKLSVMGVFEAEGTEHECVIYTAMLLDVLKQVNDREKAKEAEKETAAFRKLIEKPLEELMKSERESDE